MDSGCKVCGGPTSVAFSLDVLGRYPTDYLRCEQCGFIATADPHWLPEAYSSAISDADLGTVNRAVTLAPVVERALLLLFDHTRPCVDYGAGYGMLVRLMRDHGYDFRWQDAYSDNLFAKGHEWEPGERYELLTAFEVFEHLADPVSELETMLALSDNLLFTTEIVPPDVTPDWWYFGPQHGQHIAFHTRESLAALAGRFALHVRHYGSLHLMTRREVSPVTFGLVARQGGLSRAALAVLRRRKGVGSLLEADHAAANRALVEGQARQPQRS